MTQATLLEDQAARASSIRHLAAALTTAAVSSTYLGIASILKAALTAIVPPCLAPVVSSAADVHANVQNP